MKGIEPNIGCGLGCDGLLRARAQVFTSSSRIDEIPMWHLKVDMGQVGGGGNRYGISVVNI